MLSDIKIYMEDYVEKFKESVFKQYLLAEKSLRTYFDEHYDCANCPNVRPCCSVINEITSSVKEIMSEWDDYVISKTYPGWKSELGKEPEYCDFYSDTGCIIPEGRPNVCTEHQCNNYPNVLTQEDQTRILDGFSWIGTTMDSIIRDNLKDNDLINSAYAVDYYFSIMQKAIENNDDFSEKFEYDAVM